MKKVLLIIISGLFLSPSSSFACDTDALKLRMDRYQSVFKEATERLKMELDKIGCTKNAINKEHKPCDHKIFTKLHDDYNKIKEFIVLENESHGCPSNLVDEHFKKINK